MADLFLVEVSAPVGGGVESVFDQIAAAAANGELIEVQYGRDLGVVYGIIEHRNAIALAALLRQNRLEFEEVVPVRLVGASLEAVKARRGAYLPAHPGNGYRDRAGRPART